ncbi:MAG: N-acetylmuramoyl-L-alanine amidase [Oscillospiraceae bacterium]
MFLCVKLKSVILFSIALFLLLLALFFINFSNNEQDAALSVFDEQMPMVLVIDPGHGGEDGGAVSKEGTLESQINLDISRRIAALAGFTGTACVLTRESNEIDYPAEAKTVARRKAYDLKARAKLINATDGGVLISVHQNHFTHSSPHGPQVFYATTEGSNELGSQVQLALNTALLPENRRLASPVAKNIYLFKHVSCPAVLAECGFLSNPLEAKLLATESYRLKISFALICAFFQYSSNDKI